ncbi:M48 family metallopeptidase [Pseudomonas sp.]|jgi:Zn-dependent protease with chaperone function|uniref:M48 family metallopeptidase n=1 Tax=Pseudomonas sp. TaxID=306 RepID=UPI002ED8BB0B
MKKLKLIAVLVFFPLLLSLAGGWELQRSTEDREAYTTYQSDLAQFRPELQAIADQSGTRPVMVDVGDGETMEVHMALSRVTETQEDLDTLVPLTNVMTWLSTGTITLGLLAALVGGLGLLALDWAGRRAMHSRDQLLHSFTRVSKLLPFVLVGHVVVMGAAIAAIVAFEALGAWHIGRLSAGEMKFMFAAMIVVAGCLYSIWQMGTQLRVMLNMFQPTPMDVMGEAVTAEQAPALWAYVENLATKLGALPPDHIVLGMAAGFYVTSSDITLAPGNASLTGRTLHVPLVYLGVLDEAETTAVIGHELGHFAGADTEFSLRFVPIYDGIERSLVVIGQTLVDSEWLQRATLHPAFMLGVWFMESFDHAVMHWSRVRELEADAAGAQVAGNLAAASALVRISAIDPLLQERLDAHIKQAAHPVPGHLPVADLPSTVLHEIAALPLTLPEEEMATQLPHPSDTHPSNGERVASLQVSIDDAVRSGTRPLDAAQACAAMDRYFAQPDLLRGRLTEDYLSHHVQQDAALVETLRTHAGNVSCDVALHEGGRLRGQILLVISALLAATALGLLLTPLIAPEAVGRASDLFFAGGGIALFILLCMLPFGLRFYRRAHKTALLLTPDHFVFANLKAPLPIRDIADFHLHVGNVVLLTIQLEDSAPLPELNARSFFAPDVTLNKKKRWVLLPLSQFCRDDKKLKVPELAELIGTYINAGAARHVLQQRFEQGGELQAG